MIFKRKQDWQRNLADFIAENQDRPFKWGEWDCCLFVAASVRVITGYDLGEAFRGTYSDEAGAIEILKRYGTTEAFMTTVFGEPLISPLAAQRGDVALYRKDNGVLKIDSEYDLVGIVVGSEVAILTVERMRFAPLSRCAVAWKV